MFNSNFIDEALRYPLILAIGTLPIALNFLFENKNKKLFSMKKVSLTKEEESIYNSMIINLDNFLNNLKNKKSPTAKERIIFWGENSYFNLVNECHSLTLTN